MQSEPLWAKVLQRRENECVVMLSEKNRIKIYSVIARTLGPNKEMKIEKTIGDVFIEIPIAILGGGGFPSSPCCVSIVCRNMLYCFCLQGRNSSSEMTGTQRNRGGGSLLAERGCREGEGGCPGPLPHDAPSTLLPVGGLPGADHVPGVGLSVSSPSDTPTPGSDSGKQAAKAQTPPSLPPHPMLVLTR